MGLYFLFILWKYHNENFLLLICDRDGNCTVQGVLVTALKAGHWVLLDEINLASADTLECLSGLLESSSGSVVLADRG